MERRWEGSGYQLGQAGDAYPAPELESQGGGEGEQSGLAGGPVDGKGRPQGSCSDFFCLFVFVFLCFVGFLASKPHVAHPLMTQACVLINWS